MQRVLVLVVVDVHIDVGLWKSSRPLCIGGKCGAAHTTADAFALAVDHVPNQGVRDQPCGDVHESNACLGTQNRIHRIAVVDQSLDHVHRGSRCRIANRDDKQRDIHVGGGYVQHASHSPGTIDGPRNKGKWEKGHPEIVTWKSCSGR